MSLHAQRLLATGTTVPPRLHPVTLLRLGVPSFLPPKNLERRRCGERHGVPLGRSLLEFTRMSPLTLTIIHGQPLPLHREDHVTAIKVRPTLMLRRSRGLCAQRPGEVWRSRLRPPADSEVKLSYRKTALVVSWVVLQPFITTALLVPERRSAHVI